MPRKKSGVKKQKKGGELWIWGWSWVDGCLKIGPGVEIRVLEHNEGAIRLKLYSVEFDEGEFVMDYTSAKRKYPILKS